MFFASSKSIQLLSLVFNDDSSLCIEKEHLNPEYEPCHEKTNILVSDLVRHRPGCTATEDGQRLEISDLESRGIVLPM